VTLIKPFRALRPAPGRAAEILAPPYDVLSSAEARERAKGKPWSFLHVSKPEIDLDPAIDPYDQAVYAKAAENFDRMSKTGALMRDPKPCYYVYRLTRQGRTQTGLAAIASLSDYAKNRVRKHELTTPVKEDDRVRQIEAVNAQTGPVMNGYPAAPAIDALLAQAATGTPAVDVTADDGVRHQMWVVDDEAAISELTRAFDALPALYIADGHHRCAAAARVYQTRRGAECGGLPGGDNSAFFLSVIFPHNHVQVLPYNRVLKDLNGMTPKQLLEKLDGVFVIHPNAAASPTRRHQVGFYLGGTWQMLHFRPRFAATTDPVAKLHATLLQKYVLDPIFGIADPRTSSRINFVGGIRGVAELEKLVNGGQYACAFSLYPTSIEDLMSVADAGGVMPPKSTWFEPKLRDAMFCHMI